MRTLLASALIAGSSSLAMAQEGPTVDALLKDGFELKGVFPSKAGPGLVLQKDDDLVMCFVAETTDSPAVETQYCKPVH